MYFVKENESNMQMRTVAANSFILNNKNQQVSFKGETRLATTNEILRAACDCGIIVRSTDNKGQPKSVEELVLEIGKILVAKPLGVLHRPSSEKQKLCKILEQKMQETHLVGRARQMMRVPKPINIQSLFDYGPQTIDEAVIIFQALGMQCKVPEAANINYSSSRDDIRLASKLLLTKIYRERLDEGGAFIRLLTGAKSLLYPSNVG